MCNLLNGDMAKKITFIQEILKLYGADAEVGRSLEYLANSMRLAPNEFNDLFDPVIAAIKAKINPARVASPFLKAFMLKQKFTEIAQQAYQAKHRNCKKQSNICNSDIDKRFLAVYKKSSSESLSSAKNSKEKKSIDQLLKDEFPKDHHRLSSLRTQYYRFIKKYKTPTVEISENDFIEKAVRYCFENNIELDPRENANGEICYQHGTMSLGHDRSFYSKVMNEEKHLKALARKIYRSANGKIDAEKEEEINKVLPISKRRMKRSGK